MDKDISNRFYKFSKTSKRSVDEKQNEELSEKKVFKFKKMRQPKPPYEQTKDCIQDGSVSEMIETFDAFDAPPPFPIQEITIESTELEEEDVSTPPIAMEVTVGSSHSEDKQITNTNFSSSVTVKVKPCTSYELEIRKAKALMTLDEHFFTVILPDFDKKTYSLKKKEYVVIRRKLVIQEDSLSWLYGCSCDPFKQIYIDGLSFDSDYVQKDQDLCIHQTVAKILIPELDGWTEDEDPFETFEIHTLKSKTETDVYDIAFANKNTVLVVFEGDVGVVTFNGTRFYCNMCHKNHCIHTTYLKKRQKEDEPPEFLDDYFKIKPSTEHTKTKDAVSKKQIPFDVPPHMKHTTQSPNVYLPKFGELFLCTDDDELCRADCGGALMTSSSFYDVPLYCKGYSIMCRVKTKECELCHKVWDYDGGCQSILNMEKFLVHHSLLRDYMYHFLHSNSCTLHGYYQIMVKEHSDAGRTLERFRYNDLRSSWYAFLNLLSISFEDGAKCGQCGKIPDIVVCDATGMGYQRKFLTAGLSDSGNQFVHKRYSKHEDRIAISEQNIRKRTKKWVDAKLTKFQSNSLILEMRTKYRTIYNIMKWSLDTYTNVKKFPKSLKNIFQLLVSTSPVCSYIEPSDAVCELALKMLQPNVKSNSKLMEEIQHLLPHFHLLLSSLTIENQLPDDFKGLLLDLTDKAKQPFKVAERINTEKCTSTSEICSFPNLPPLRKRGCYVQDKVVKKEKDCRKNYRGHPNLTSGIFTIYCPHGVCFGFQVMEKEESPNIPFTIFKTRLPTAPKYIIYDNACHLHTYALNRDPLYFQWTKFLVDRFHWRNHTACSLGYNMAFYSFLEKINSEINEQENAKVKKLKSQLAYMTPERFIAHCKLFFWFRNKKANEK